MKFLQKGVVAWILLSWLWNSPVVASGSAVAVTDWESLPSQISSYPPAQEGWAVASVPACELMVEPGGRWFRSHFQLGALGDGERLILHFRRIQYSPKVWLNGQLVVESDSAREMGWEVDATDAAVPESDNELLVWIGDWTRAIPSPGIFSNIDVGVSPLSVMKGRIPYPRPSDYLCAGLLEPVEARIVPAVGLCVVGADLRLTYSQTQVRLHLWNRTESTRQFRLQGTIGDADGVPLTSFSQDLFYLSPGEKELTLSTPWVPQDRWDPVGRTMATVRAELKEGATLVDACESMVGLREVRVVGSELRLNEIPLNLVVKEGWVPTVGTGDPEPGEVEDLMQRGYDALVMNGGTWPETWLEAADEAGVWCFLTLPLDCDPYDCARTSTGEFREAALQELDELIRRAGRHPSVAGVVISRGFVDCAAADRQAEFEILVDELLASLETKAPGLLRLVAEEPGLAGKGQMDWRSSPSDALAWAGDPDGVGLLPSGTTFPLQRPLVLTQVSAGPDGPWEYVAIRGFSALLDRMGNLAWARQNALRRWVSAVLLEGAVGWAPAADVQPGELPGVDRWREWTGPVANPGVENVLLTLEEVPARCVMGESVTVGLRATVQGGSSRAGTLTVLDKEGDLVVQQDVELSPGKSLKLQVSLVVPSPPTGFYSYPFEFQAALGDSSRTFTLVSVRPPAGETSFGKVGLMDPAGALEGHLPLDAEEVVSILNPFDIDQDMELVVLGPGTLKSFLDGGKGARVYTDLEQVILSYVDNGGMVLVMEHESLDGALPFRIQTSSRGHLFGDPSTQIARGMGRGVYAAPYPDLGQTVNLVEVPEWGTLRCALRGGMEPEERGCAVAELARGQGAMVVFQLPVEALAQEASIAWHLLSASLGYLSGGLRPRRQIGMNPDLESWWPSAADVPVRPESVTSDCVDLWVTDGVSFVEGEERFEDEEGRTYWVVSQGEDAVIEALEPPVHWLEFQALPVLPVGIEFHSDFAELYSEAGSVGPLASGEWKGLFPVGEGTAVTLQPGSWSTSFANLEDPACIPAGGRVEWSLAPQGTGPFLVSLSLESQWVRDEAVNVAVALGERTLTVSPEAGGIWSGTLAFPSQSAAPASLAIAVPDGPIDYLGKATGVVCVRSVEVTKTRGVDTASQGTVPGLMNLKEAVGGPTTVLDFFSGQTLGSERHELAFMSRWLGRAGVPVDTPLGTYFEASDLEVADASLVEMEGSVLWLRSNGRLEKEVDFPVAGRYRFLVWAVGTPADGKYPSVRLRVDGSLQGKLLTQPWMKGMFLDAVLPKGPHTVSLCFEEDALLPPEDRDLGVLRLGVFALRANQPPQVGLEMVSREASVEARATCLWDPDADSVVVRMAMKEDGCPGVEDSWEEGTIVTFTPEAYAWFFVGLEAVDQRGAMTRVCKQHQFVPTALVEPRPDEVTPDVVAQETEETVGEGLVVGEVAEEAPDDLDTRPGKSGGCSAAADAARGRGDWVLWVLFAAVMLLVLLGRAEKSPGSGDMR